MRVRSDVVTTAMVSTESSGPLALQQKTSSELLSSQCTALRSLWTTTMGSHMSTGEDIKACKKLYDAMQALAGACAQRAPIPAELERIEVFTKFVARSKEVDANRFERTADRIQAFIQERATFVAHVGNLGILATAYVQLRCLEDENTIGNYHGRTTVPVATKKVLELALRRSFLEPSDEDRTTRVPALEQRVRSLRSSQGRVEYGIECFPDAVDNIFPIEPTDIIVEKPKSLPPPTFWQRLWAFLTRRPLALPPPRE